MKTLKNPSTHAMPYGHFRPSGCPLYVSGVFFMEKWKAIKDYEGLYEISNQGRFKLLARTWIAGKGGMRSRDEKITKGWINGSGYLTVALVKNGEGIQITIHTLVWDHFGDQPRNGRKLQVDHIDNDRTDNRIENLQVLSPRRNVIKSYLNKETSSQYTGVYWNKQEQKWMVQIWIYNKSKFLGLFNDEYEAHIAYQKELKKIES